MLEGQYKTYRLRETQQVTAQILKDVDDNQRLYLTTGSHTVDY